MRELVDLERQLLAFLHASDCTLKVVQADSGRELLDLDPAGRHNRDGFLVPEGGRDGGGETEEAAPVLAPQASQAASGAADRDLNWDALLDKLLKP